MSLPTITARSIIDACTTRPAAWFPRCWRSSTASWATKNDQDFAAVASRPAAGRHCADRRPGVLARARVAALARRPEGGRGLLRAAGGRSDEPGVQPGTRVRRRGLTAPGLRRLPHGA